MNIINKKKIHVSIVFRLWGLMMLIILMAVAFMWFSQIFLFEQNYIDAAVNEVDARLNPIAAELKTVELSNNTDLLHNASKSVKGKALVFDREGQLYASYSNSHPIDAGEVDWFVKILADNPDFQTVFDGVQYQNVLDYYENNYYYEIGIPVQWQGQEAVLFLNHPIEEIVRVQDINRQQLITLSILLTMISGLVALLLAKQFAKPIKTIKKAVEQLAQGNLTAAPAIKLKDELGDLSDSVGELSQALQRVDVLRKEVISNVSHELSSPLSLIIGYGEMVRDISWPNETERNDHLNLIIHEARRMSSMVDDIMDYSQFQAGYIQLRKGDYNLYEIVSSEIDLCRSAAKQFDIQLVLQSNTTDIPVYLDAVKINQVLRNLLNNAINHTDNKQTIFITIETTTELTLSVKNPGKPIPPKKRELIWERYYSSQHSGTRRQGTGIGLSIVSTLLDAHGYVYGVDYQDGYNCFWFTIPNH